MKKNKFTIHKNTTLMSRLIRYFLAVIVIMLILNFYSISGFKAFYSNFYSLLKEPLQVQNFKNEIDDAYKSIENYAHSGSLEYSQKYKEITNKLNEQLKSIEAASKGSDYYLLKDTINILATFNEKSIQIMKQYDQGTGQIYINGQLSELSKLKGFLQIQIDSILQSQLVNVEKYYNNFFSDIKTEEIIIYIISFIVTVLCVLLSYRLSKHLSNPIHEVVLKLQKVSQGDFDVIPTKKTTNDEINVLIDSSNMMISDLKNMIEGMKKNAELEAKLSEQEIRNLEVSNLLKQSQLNLLQSQINPHFLYNTLNSISALAEIEEASQTKKMLDSMYSLIRYNLKKQNEKVTLKEEVEIIKDYIYIQKIRFGNRIDYFLDIDKNALGHMVPSMILQPFVENALVHGLEPKAGKGLLNLSIKKHTNIIVISIKDNGLGMSKEKIDEILLFDTTKPNESISKNIGIKNVIQRLKIINEENNVSITSEIGVGTEVVITLVI